MASGFHWYPSARKGISQAVADAVEDTARAIVSDVESREVVPHAESARKPGHVAGRLASSVRVDRSTGGTRIVWDVPFAARAYFHPEWQFGTAVHAGAKGRWMDDYLPNGGRVPFVIETYRKALRRRRWFG